MTPTDIQQGTDEWKAARAGKATASCIAKIMATGRDGSPSATRATYMGELAAERLTGVMTEGFTSPAMQHGIDTESEARLAYEFERGVTVKMAGFVDHPTIAMSGASPDSFVGDTGLLEIKCPNTATHIATLQGSKIKREYLLQMQWQMACTEREWCDFASYDNRLSPALQLHVQRVKRDQALIDEIEEAVTAFLSELDAMEADLRQMETRLLEAA